MTKASSRSSKPAPRRRVPGKAITARGIGPCGGRVGRRPMPYPQLHPALAQALDARGFESLSPVQSAVIAEEADGRDLIVAAKTGSGKTVAFGLAIASALLEGEAAPVARAPLALVITPTRELAIQVSKELQWLYGAAGGRVVTCVGGMD